VINTSVCLPVSISLKLLDLFLTKFFVKKISVGIKNMLCT